MICTCPEMLQFLTSIIRKKRPVIFFLDIKILKGLNPLTSKHCINRFMYTVRHALQKLTIILALSRKEVLK